MRDLEYRSRGHWRACPLPVLAVEAGGGVAPSSPHVPSPRDCQASLQVSATGVSGAGSGGAPNKSKIARADLCLIGCVPFVLYRAINMECVGLSELAGTLHRFHLVVMSASSHPLFCVLCRKRGVPPR